MSDTPKQNDWSKPAAMAIPKEGYFKNSNRAGTAHLSQDAGVPWLLDHREGHSRPRASRLRIRQEHRECGGRATGLPRSAQAALPALGALRHQGRDLLHYQGIFDTDFDKYTEDAVALFSKTGITTVFENLEGFPKDWKTNAAGVRQIRPRTPVPELFGIRRIPVCERRRDQEGAQAQGGVLRMLDQMQ